MASTADIKNGLVIKMDNQLFSIVEFLHVKPGKGGAFVRTKIKNVLSGRVLDKTFRSGEKLEIVKLDARKMQYLYSDEDSFIFMDQETFDQVSVPAPVVGDQSKFLKEGEEVKVLFNGENPINLELPNFVNFKIVECEPGMKGDTVTNVTKPAMLETGAIVKVPLFIEKGESIKVDIRKGEYLERAKA